MRIEHLKTKRDNFKAEYKAELIYSESILHMHKRTKEIIDKLNSKIIEMNEKLTLIEVSKKNLFDNIDQHTIKKESLLKMLRNLQQETAKANDVIVIQDKTIEKIIGGLDGQQQVVEDIKNELDSKIIKHTKETKASQDHFFKEIANNEVKRKNMTDKENYIIKFILGMDLLKR